MAHGNIAVNEQGLALLGDFKIVRPVPIMIEKLKLKITTKSQIEKRQARAEDAMLLKLKLQRPAPITPNPVLAVRCSSRQYHFLLYLLSFHLFVSNSLSSISSFSLFILVASCFALITQFVEGFR